MTAPLSWRRLIVPDVRGLPRAYWLLFAAALVDRLGGFANAYIAVYLTTRGGFSVSMAGFVISLMALGGLVGTPVGGALADRIGRKPLLVGGMAMTGAAWLHVGLAERPAHVAIAVFLAGVASSLPRPAMVAAIADVVPEGDRRRAYGLHYWAVNLGFAFSALLAGALVRADWRWVFGLDALTCGLAATFLSVAMTDTRPSLARPVGPAASVERPSLIERARAPFADRALLLLVAQGLLGASMFSQAHVALATELARDGLALSYGPLLAINGAMIVLLQPTLTQITSRFRATRVLGLAAILIGFGFSLTAWCDTWWQHAGAIAVWTLGEILQASTMPAAIARLAPADKRATYQGVYQLSWPLSAFAPAAGAYVLDRGGSLALWVPCFFGGLACVLVQRRLARSGRLD
jgi:MFS family permease